MLLITMILRSSYNRTNLTCDFIIDSTAVSGRLGKAFRARRQSGAASGPQGASCVSFFAASAR